MSNVLSKINKILADEIIRLDKLIEETAFSNNHLLASIIKHIQKMNGKRIRILLALLIGRMYDYNILKDTREQTNTRTTRITFLPRASILNPTVCRVLLYNM
jgi:geranylgeranyl pyrophosphate synthase